MISPFNIFPPYWGGASRIYNLGKFLSNENRVLLLYNDYKQIKSDGDYCKEYYELISNPNVKLYAAKSFGKFSQVFNPLLIVKGLKMIREESFDFIMAEFAWSGLHAIIFSFLTRIPFILDEHNVEFLRFDRMQRGNKVTRFMLKIYEKISCTLASKVFCVSEVDKGFLISTLGINEKKIVVVPNGVDTEKFFPDERKRIETRKKLNLKDEPVILFFGKLDYKPNYEAVKVIRYEILPKVLKKIPKAKFLIVGDNPPMEFAHENMIFTGMVEQIEDYINASDVVICPLMSGGGTRIKILEAIACGKSVISTGVGAEGIENIDFDENIIIENEWDKFVNRCIERLINATQDTPSQIFVYDWEVLSRKIYSYIFD